MFIQAKERIINLYLLQNIKVVEIDGTYNVRFIFMNGEIYDEAYESQSQAENAYDDYKSEILAK